MRIIDCDSHFIVRDIYQYVREEFQSLLPKYTFTEGGRVKQITYDVDPASNGRHDPKSPTIDCWISGTSNFAERIEDLGFMKVDLQLLAPQDRAMRFNYSVEKNLAAEMAHSYNLTVKNLVDQYPDKFFGAALLPMQGIDLALKELHWAIENNFKIIYIDNAMFNNESGHENVWSTIRSQMDKIYKVCEENKIVIYMHFLMTHNVPYVIPEKIKHMNSLANMDGTMRRLEVSLCDLLSDDIFDHYPDLQIVITEAMQRRFGKVLKILNDSYNLEPGLFKGKKHFINYIKENLFFTVDIEMKDSFNMLLKYAGSNRLLFSTDYPHDDPSGVNKWNDVRDLYASGLPQEDLENIAYRNAEKLFRL